MIYQLFTLADITYTGEYYGQSTLKKYQQQNFDTVIQTIGLCGNLYFDSVPTKIETNRFNTLVQECWYFEWTMEIPDLFEKDGDPIAKLSEVFQFVPFITELTELSYFPKAMFIPGQNIIFDYKKPVGLKELILDKY